MCHFIHTTIQTLLPYKSKTIRRLWKVSPAIVSLKMDINTGGTTFINHHTTQTEETESALSNFGCLEQMGAQHHQEKHTFTHRCQKVLTQQYGWIRILFLGFFFCDKYFMDMSNCMRTSSLQTHSPVLVYPVCLYSSLYFGCCSLIFVKTKLISLSEYLL